MKTFIEKVDYVKGYYADLGMLLSAVSPSLFSVIMKAAADSLSIQSEACECPDRKVFLSHMGSKCALLEEYIEEIRKIADSGWEEKEKLPEGFKENYFQKWVCKEMEAR